MPKVSTSDLRATVRRMERELRKHDEALIWYLLARYDELVPRFAEDLGDAREEMLSRGAALMLIQQAFHGSSPQPRNIQSRSLAQRPACIFCKIANRELPASVIYEDDDIMALMDVNPVQEGHTLVIPKKHFVDIWDIELATLARIDEITQRVAKKMSSALKTEGINTFSASGKPAGQEIFHFHMHVIPLGKGEGTKFVEWWLPRVRKAKREELDALAAKLRL